MGLVVLARLLAELFGPSLPHDGLDAEPQRTDGAREYRLDSPFFISSSASAPCFSIALVRALAIDHDRFGSTRR